MVSCFTCTQFEELCPFFAGQAVAAAATVKIVNSGGKFPTFSGEKFPTSVGR